MGSDGQGWGRACPAPCPALEVMALTSWVSVWAEPTLRVHHGVTQSQRVQASAGEMHMMDALCSSAARAAFPTFCSGLSTTLLLPWFGG